MKQNIIDAQNALNGDQNLANAKDKANAFVNSLNGLNQQQQDLAHKAINNADTVSDVTDIVNNQIDLNDAMETLKHLVDNEIQMQSKLSITKTLTIMLKQTSMMPNVWQIHC